MPAATERQYEIGDEVLVYREVDRYWHGPYLVIGIVGKIITISDPETKYQQDINIATVKPYLRDAPAIDVNTDRDEVLHSMLDRFKSGTSSAKVPTYAVCRTEVLKKGDPRASSFGPAIQKEIKGLVDRGTWKVIVRSEMPPGAKLLGGRFVLAIKEIGTEKELYKTRYVAQRQKDNEKYNLVHNTATSRHHSARVLVGLAAIFGFRLYCTDVTQAYLQSCEKLMRDVYVDPSGKF